ncbi:unnamed protein product [Clonostachys rosea f. rosea IK726]|uniref:AB hydrolase-1 domain-containing protein n=2 Tax=Bionectria ochroleuca TaxID=29856 RepID=A0A0B7KSV9_BIOOC|nr:unnamed protein product [Clonostachys rosea f. rosea IK726]
MNIAPRKNFRASTGHTYNYYSSAHADKTTILFIHGFPYTANIWRKHVAYFETRGFGCVVPDLLGLGQTDKPHSPEDYCPKTSAQSLAEILQYEEVQDTVVVGHDWGSQIASRFALFHPERTLALVLVAVPYYPPGSFDLDAVNNQTEQAFGHSIFGYWYTFVNETNLLEDHRNFMPRGALKTWLENDQKCEIGEYVTDLERTEFFANDWKAAIQYYQCYMENLPWKVEQELPRDKFVLEIPSLMISATDDACAPLPVVESTLPSFKNVQHFPLKGGHHGFLEQLNETNQAILSLLQQNSIFAQKRGL